MRIAFDLDGVLADLHQPFVQAAVRLFPELDASSIGAPDVGASPPDEEAPRKLTPQQAARVALSNRQADAVWKHLGAIENFWEGLSEIEPGAIAKLAGLADERGWEVIFITSRPKSVGRTVQRQSQRWIQHLGFPMPSLFVVHGSRGRVAEALRLDVVDRRPAGELPGRRARLEGRRDSGVAGLGELSARLCPAGWGLGSCRPSTRRCQPWSRPTGRPRRAAASSTASGVCWASRRAPASAAGAS